MSADTADGHKSCPADSLVVTEHAIDRWIERVCSKQRGVAPWDLEDVFREAVPVGIPGAGRGRLHPPTGSVIVFARQWSHGPSVLITVLFADPVPLGDDHLQACEACEQRFDPAESDACPWCDGGRS